MQEVNEKELKIDDKDLVITTCRAGGSGGQHVNKTELAIQIKHVPTGIFVRCEADRSQKQNKDIAMQMLRSRILSAEKEKDSAKRANDRKQQVGSGMRGDKRRTVRQQDGQVTDHLIGKTWKYDDYVKGNW